MEDDGLLLSSARIVHNEIIKPWNFFITVWLRAVTVAKHNAVLEKPLPTLGNKNYISRMNYEL